MLRLELFEFVDGKKKKVVHEQDFLPGRKVREVLELIDKATNGEFTSEVEVLDRKVEFVAGLFPDVTTDDIYDGTESPELLKILQNVVDQVLGNEKKNLTDEK